MLVIDSSVWIDFFNGKPTPQTLFLKDKADRNQILIGDLILCEVLQGFKSNSDFNAAKHLLLSFAFENMLNQDISLQAAQNYRELRAKGITVRKTIDMMIATFCIYNHHQLLHSDRDFHAIEQHLNLKVIHC